MSDRPFAGIEVVEFGQFIAVPMCAQLLADGGAHVIKVESLDGDPTRHLAPLAPGETRHFMSRNRGKHSLPLELKHPAAREVMHRLLARADVCLTNLRPGLTTELGLDYESLNARFPHLVVGNVTAFGEKGPDANLAGMDLMMQARSGLMASAGRTRDGLPVATDSPIIDYMCAMTLAFGISSALLRRERTGRGGEVDVSLFLSALSLLNTNMLRVESIDGPVHRAALGDLAEARASGASYLEQAGLQPNIRTSSMSSVYYRTLATKDATIAIACVSPQMQRALMKATGLTDDSHTKPIPRERQPEHYSALQALIESTMKERTTAEWKTIFDAHGVPNSSVKFPIEMLDDEQVLANGFATDLEHGTLGAVRVLSTPVSLDGPGFAASPFTAAFGSETRDILAGLGFSAAEVDGLLNAGATTERPHIPR